MTMVLPLGWQVLDANGDPYSGAKAQFYATGTTTPQATYSDAGLTTPNANPLVADSAGRFGPAYGPTTTDYKVVLMTSANVEIATYDPVQMTGAVAELSVDTDQLAAGAVTNAKMANMTPVSFKMRRTGGVGPPEDVHVSDARSELKLRPLATVTASASAALDFTALDSALYCGYIIRLENILVATDTADLWLRVSGDGGATYLSGSYSHNRRGIAAGSGADAGSNSDAKILLAGSLSNVAGETLSGVIEFYAGGAVAYDNKCNWNVDYVGSSADFTHANGGGAHNAAITLGGIRIMASSGNITSGTMRVWGILK
jgi:hypothetical protein